MTESTTAGKNEVLARSALELVLLVCRGPGFLLDAGAYRAATEIGWDEPCTRRMSIRGEIRDHGSVAAPPIEALERWEEHGGIWRIRHVSDAAAIVDLCTCHGEPVDRVESDDPDLIAYLRRSERPVT